jgi:hypothetical protein
MAERVGEVLCFHANGLQSISRSNMDIAQSTYSDANNRLVCSRKEKRRCSQWHIAQTCYIALTIRFIGFRSESDGEEHLKRCGRRCPAKKAVKLVRTSSKANLGLDRFRFDNAFTISVFSRSEQIRFPQSGGSKPRNRYHIMSKVLSSMSTHHIVRGLLLIFAATFLSACARPAYRHDRRDDRRDYRYDRREDRRY